MTKIMVIAGEASGDLHGGNVLKELKKLRPDLDVIGTGGVQMSQVADHLYYRVEDLAVIGFYEVIKRYGFYKSVFETIVKKLDETKPDVLILVDYPGFNLKLAEEAKKRNIRVVYYIAPQVWAWKKGRIKKLKELVDELIVLFPFEVDFFRAEGMETKCFGHPLLDIVKPDSDKETFCERWAVDANKTQICMLPGSRANEISKHLPLLFATCRELDSRRSDFQYIIPLASTVDRAAVKSLADKSDSDVRLVTGDTYNAVAHSTFAMVASGTATLETAILQTPQVIYYKSSSVTYFIGKYLLRIKAIGLPNIIAGEIRVPENPHFKNPAKMADLIQFYLEHPQEYQSLKADLVKIKDELGENGAYRKTAEYLHSIL